MGKSTPNVEPGWVEQTPLPRPSEVDKAAREETQAAMAQIAAFALGKSAELSSSGAISVSIAGDTETAAPPSEHDQLSINDLMGIYSCGYSKAQRMMKALPSFKVGDKRYVLRRDLEAYVAEHGTIPINW